VARRNKRCGYSSTTATNIRQLCTTLRCALDQQPVMLGLAGPARHSMRVTAKPADRVSMAIGNVGPGTLVIAVCMGPLAHRFLGFATVRLASHAAPGEPPTRPYDLAVHIPMFH
jgi:hypothetical protein